MTLNAKALPVEWKNSKINFIDTPGYADFVGEVKAGLRVTDAALVVVTAEKGVEVGSELTWQYADERKLPRMVLINKLDRENTSFDQALESLRNQFGLKVVPLQLPIGEQTGFRGVVDLVSQKGYTFEGGKKVQEVFIPAELKDKISSYREQLIESAVESDDDVMEKFLEGEELSDEEILSVVKKGTRSCQLIPVLCGSGSKNIGVQTLLDAIVDYLPSAADSVPEDAKAFDNNLSMFVFKTAAAQVGTISNFRVYTGTLKPDSHVYNVQTKADERIKRKYGVDLEAREPRISYRETIRKKARANGRHKRQSGGHGQFGDVWLEIEPLPLGGEETFVFEDKIVGGVVPGQFIPGVEKAGRDSLH